MNERIRVLEIKAGDEDVVRHFRDYMTVVGGELGTVLLPRSPLTPGPAVVVHTWREHGASDPLVVQLMEDRNVPAWWLSVRGSTEERRDALIDLLDKVLPIADLADLKRSARHPEKRPGVLIELALATEGEPNGGVRKLLEQAIASKRADVRIAAATAAGILKWSELTPPLSVALDREDDEAARRVLAAALAACGG